jgi:hypothetical protein
MPFMIEHNRKSLKMYLGKIRVKEGWSECLWKGKKKCMEFLATVKVQWIVIISSQKEHLKL